MGRRAGGFWATRRRAQKAIERGEFKIELPKPTPDQVEYLEKVKAAGEYDPSIVAGGPRKKT